MNLKVGDKVQIKNIDWYNANKDEDGKVDSEIGLAFMPEMSLNCGKVVTIDKVGISKILIAIKEDDKFYYSPYMFEKKLSLWNRFKLLFKK